MKNILCISASNVITAKDKSASTKTCQLIHELIENTHIENFDIRTIKLIDYDLMPCNMCEQCIPSNQCSKDDGFNEIFESMIAADAIFIVCPHYAPIPSKLMILLEKLQEIYYLNYCNNSDYKFPLIKKHAAIVAHGGMIENFEDIYKENLLNPLRRAFGGIGLQIAKVGDDFGVVFGAKDFIKRDDAIPPDISHDWDNIKSIIKPLVDEVLSNF